MHGRTWLLLLAALMTPAVGRAARAEEAAGAAAGRLLGAVLQAVEQTATAGAAAAKPKVRAEEAAMQEIEKRAAQDQRQQQIEQQARHWEQLFQGPLQAELELVRRTCGSLPPEARRTIAAAGDAAVQKAAKQFAAWNFGDRGGKKQFDPRQTIHDEVLAAVKPHAPAAEFAALEHEHAARLARRERAARTLIVAKLDRFLELSVAQREAIAADIEKRWEAGWARALEDQGNIRVNNFPPAPDFADPCIAPHLDDRQREVWKQWSQQAGWSRMGQHTSWNHDGQRLQPDPWWKP